MGEQVDKIIKALTELESDLGSLHKDVEVMQHELKSQTQTEIETLTMKTKDMANTEAQKMISVARDQAKLESDKIIKDNEHNIVELKNQIDDTIDGVVNHIVKLALK
ncbi:MAG: hypothetical protein OXF28_02975 [Thaumarchaeota archaeon]|nr:hypothetical protein [Nitrososphaerota archaeon]MCY3976080.1 hypothetical protein [Nitrososphaerota archaeon]